MSLVAISQHVAHTPQAANARAEFVDAAAQRAMVLSTNLLDASSLVASSKAERPRADSDCASSPTASATAFSTRRLNAKRSRTDVETPSALRKAASSSSSPTTDKGKGDGVSTSVRERFALRRRVEKAVAEAVGDDAQSESARPLPVAGGDERRRLQEVGVEDHRAVRRRIHELRASISCLWCVGDVL